MLAKGQGNREAIDGTHIKANVNMKKKARKAVPIESKRYAKELREEINRDREEHGKKPFDIIQPDNYVLPMQNLKIQ